MYAGQCSLAATVRPARASGISADPSGKGESAVGSAPSTVGQRATTAPRKTAATNPAFIRHAASMNGRRPKAAQTTTRAATNRPQNESKWKKSAAEPAAMAITKSALRRAGDFTPQTTAAAAATVDPRIAAGCPCHQTASAARTTATRPLRGARTFFLGMLAIG